MLKNISIISIFLISILSASKADAQLYFSGKVLLSAPLQSNGLMEDSLRQKGFLPFISPYDGCTYAAPGVFSVAGTDAVVDWVQIRFRSSTAVVEKSCLLLRDGTITDENTNAVIEILAPVDSYEVQILHRNHLGIQTAAKYYFGENCTAIDFTNPSTAMYNNAICARVLFGKRALYAGNADANKYINYQGSESDRMNIYYFNGVIGYTSADIDLSGSVTFGTALTTDSKKILINLGNDGSKYIIQQTTW